MNQMSKSEREALDHFATLPMKIVPSQCFAPRLTSAYLDGDGVKQYGKPDALATQPRTFTFVESKPRGACLNHHPSKDSCHRALQMEYALTMHDGRDREYNELTEHFRHANYPFLLQNSWNNSLFKVLALQRLHGWEKYIVSFSGSPSALDAKRYAEAGLVFCTNDTLAQMLGIIELAAHGLYYPFQFRATRARYQITVNPEPNPAHAGMTPEQITAGNRAAYEAVVAVRKAQARGQA
jgi:hypothetical protein